MKKILACFVLALAFFSTPHLALAHAIPLACLPRMGINVTKPPAQIICQFNQPLYPTHISLQVLNAKGERVDQNDTHFYENDNQTVVVTLDPSKISNGIYSVAWQVQDTLDDGVTSGTFQFGVNTVVPPTPTYVLPGVVMTPVPTQSQTNATTDLISRFLIGVGVVVLVAMGVLFWRMRATRDVSTDES